MLPEISRRCLSCGAAVRAGSRFCPQCGQSLAAEAAPGASDEPGVEAARTTTPPAGERAQPTLLEEPRAPEPSLITERTPPTKEFAAFEPPPVGDASTPVPVALVPPEVEVKPETPLPSAPEPPAEARPGSEEAGRAGDLARGRVARVREGTRARVGRMREEAIVVLEETPDDSGLRFVLVAAVLFLLFIGLLFLSTTVLR